MRVEAMLDALDAEDIQDVLIAGRDEHIQDVLIAGRDELLLEVERLKLENEALKAQLGAALVDRAGLAEQVRVLANCVNGTGR